MGELDGRVFRSYEIIRELGHGGMAVVYLGRQTTMDRLVAIKVILSVYSREADFRARFDQEARTIAHLEHPHILPVIDYGEEDFGAFLVMRYVDDGTLETRLQSAPLPFDEAYDMLGKVASALDYAHGKGIVHRDLKPANILLDGAGNPYLTDFGIAKILQATTQLTRTGATVGTPAYMAPEQWKSEPVGPYTDQYALGVVLYQMITGDLPFKADTTFGYMHKHIYEQPEPPDLVRAGVPPAASEVILRCLAKDPAERYPTVRGLHEAFGAALYGEHAAPTKPAAEGATVVGMEQGAFDSGITPPPVTRRARGAGGAQALPEDATAALPGRRTPPPPAAAAPSVRRGGGGLIALVALLTVIALSVIVFGGRALLGGVPTATPTRTATPPIEVAAAPTEAAPTFSEEIIGAAPQEPSATSAPSDTPAPTETVVPTGTDTPTLTLTTTPTVTATATVTDTATITPTLTATLTLTSTPTETWTPDSGATEDAALVATSQRVARDLTATASALILELATEQAAQMGTRIAVSSFTPTPTATWTVTPSPTVTASLPPTITPRPQVTLLLPTPTPRPTNTPAPVSCPGLLPSRLQVGMVAVVSDDDPRPVNVRGGPGLAATRVGQFAVATRFTVLEGPVCQNNYAWFRVREEATNGLTGWVAESGEGVYYLEPLAESGGCPGGMASRLQVGAVAVVDTPNGGPLRLRSEVGQAGRVIALIPEGVRLEMRAGPVCEAERAWWQVRLADGRTGWVSETDADSYFLVPG